MHKCDDELLEEFSLTEEAKSAVRRLGDPQFAEYNKRRPLDPVLKGKQDKLNGQFMKLNVTLS